MIGNKDGTLQAVMNLASLLLHQPKCPVVHHATLEGKAANGVPGQVTGLLQQMLVMLQDRFGAEMPFTEAAGKAVQPGQWHVVVCAC